MLRDDCLVDRQEILVGVGLRGGIARGAVSVPKISCHGIFVMLVNLAGDNVGDFGVGGRFDAPEVLASSAAV